MNAGIADPEVRKKKLNAEPLGAVGLTVVASRIGGKCSLVAWVRTVSLL